ncbi:hypothetical protein BDK92_1543 [Micromonospora pisi]|uniref:Uncharacterized protein n=1 Tax=Micromonospora pisi TaxID=589240 RepID=A0A495JFF7_9ACTN|nr:hypothetical protein [Micromonospora pisi]RKR87268.1 hypothetical protein BDK92_1543 [Micromonospora pisi]
MTATDPGSARTEAERLVATALAAARLGASGRPGGFGPLGDLVTGVLGHAGDGTNGSGFATGSAECRACPICRTIAALRDPSPEFAERLATGAGDFAAGLASLLRALSTATDTSTPEPETAPAGPDPYGAPAGPDPYGAPTGPDTFGATPDTFGTPADLADDAVWREATRTRHDSWPAPEQDVWAAATRAAPDPRSDQADPPADPAEHTGAASRPAPTGSTGAVQAAGSGGTPPVVPAARIPGEPVPAEGDGV